jgi:uncharacterized membrane protein
MQTLHTEKTSTGLDANLAAALSYLVGFVTGILFLLVEKENRFVRFHAMQSTIFFLALLAIQVSLKLVPVIGFLVFILVLLPFSVIAWLVLMFKAYMGEEFKVPFVGNVAAERI